MKELPLWFNQVVIISVTDITLIKQLSGFQNCPRDANNGIHAATIFPYYWNTCDFAKWSGNYLSSHDAIIGPQWQKVHEYAMFVPTVNFGALAYPLKS